MTSQSASPIDMREREGALKQQVTDILAEARRQGAQAAEVDASEHVGLGVSVRKGDLENVEFNQDRGFGLTVYVDGGSEGLKKGSASSSDVRPEAIQSMVEAALNIARYTEADPCSGLPEPDRLARSFPDLDLYHPWDLDTDAAVEQAKACEAAGLAADRRISNSEGSQLNTQRACQVFGNSQGFLGSRVGTRHSVSCVLIAEADGTMQRDYWYTLARSADDLEALDAVGVRAAERTVARLSPRSVPTGSWPVVFAPEAALGLLGHVMGALAGSSIYKKSSWLLDALGEQALAEHLDIFEEPLLAGAIGSASFDGEGVATQEKHFVQSGVVQTWMLSTYSARKLGLASTGNAGGTHNLTLTGKTLPKAELLREVGTGFYVTELMGQGVNGVTGDYSRGASGFWIKDGVLQYAVDGVTIAGNLKNMLKQVVAVGDDVDRRGNYRAPSVWVEGMTVAGS